MLRLQKAAALFIITAFTILPEEAIRAQAASLEGHRHQGTKKIEYKSENLRDPFRGLEIKTELKPMGEPKTLPTLTVQGIVWGGNFPQAIINNKVVRIGDTVDGAQVVDISKDNIIVKFEGREYNLFTQQSQGGKDEKPL